MTLKLDLKATMTPRHSISKLAIVSFVLTILAGAMLPGTTYAKQTIVALVNDEPISAFDLKQRMNLLLANSRQVRSRMQARLKSSNINEQFRTFAMRHNPKSREEVQRLQKKFIQQIKRNIVKGLRPQARKLAMDELIEERLKLQEAKRLNIVIEDAKVSGSIAQMAKRNKMTEKQFAKMMRSQGVDIVTMKQRMKADMSWQQAVQRKYGRELSLTNNYLNRVDVSAYAAQAGQKNIELQLHRITLPIKGKIDQRIMVERFAEADKLRSQFKSCELIKKLSGSVEGARYENLGRKRASSFPEPTRSQLIQAKIGEMPPPSLSPKGIQLYAVCGRRKVAPANKKRVAAKKRRQQQEFNILSERHLRDLKQDAFIEYR